MSSSVHDILGYKFYSPDTIVPAIDHLLIVAPLMADAGRANGNIARQCAHVVGFSITDPADKRSKKRIVQLLRRQIQSLLDEIDQAVSRAIEFVLCDDLETAAESLEAYAPLWVGLYPIDEAADIIYSIKDFQDEFQLADGYDGLVITPRIARLRIWND